MEALFQLSVFHSYFDSGLFDACRFVADEATQTLLARYQLQLRKIGSKFGLYGSFQGSRASFSRYLSQQLQARPLMFYLQTNSAQFSAITNLPLDWVGQLQYGSHHYLQRTHLFEQVYELQPQYSARSVEKNDVIAVIAIDPHDLNTLSGMAPFFSIQYQAKDLHWVYYVVNRRPNPLKNPIIKNQNGMVFEAPIAAQLPSGETALGFSSGSLQIPLRESPSQYFDLVEQLTLIDIDSNHNDGENPGSSPNTNTKSIERCAIQGLPTPQIGQFSVKQIAGKPYLFSVMYVYL